VSREVLVVPRGDLPVNLAPALSWKPRGARLVLLWCDRGHVSRLTAAVGADGLVDGAVACPFPRCAFRTRLQLEGWDLGAVDAVTNVDALLAREGEWLTDPDVWLRGALGELVEEDRGAPPFSSTPARV
jgi:hypothetical protein